MAKTDPFATRKTGADSKALDPDVHVFGNGHVCHTEKRGQLRRRGQSLFEIVVDATEGFVPLWAKGSTLRWRFNERSFRRFASPAAAKTAVRRLFAEALVQWGSASPVRFAERSDAWDFEIVVRNADDCDAAGCVLASAFFPDSGQHRLTIYPKMFTQPRSEQIETMVHEIGHVFGLRHFFASISETRWPSEIFGTHKRFSIMNYGGDSRLTAEDKSDLANLYRLAWSGQLPAVNGTPVRFVKPFSALRVQ
jgi:Matrixin